MRTEEGSAISVVFVLLLAGTVTAVAAAPAPAAGDADAGDRSLAQAGNDTASTAVTVSGTGEAAADPDVAVVRLESAATAADPGTAAERLAANTTELREALRESDLSVDEVRTTYYDLSEDGDRPRPEGAGEANETTYRAQQGFAVRLDNTSQVGALIDLAVANGATGVDGVEFTLSDENRSAVRDRALQSAMFDARQQAETLAATEELEISAVNSIEADDGGVRPFVAEEAALADDAATEIEGGPVTVEVRVRVTYGATA